MKLSKRQEQIIAVVKEHQPVSGERISDILAVSRATLRSDLSFLTLSGILKASPKVGYTYESDNMEAFFFFDVFQTKVQEIMSPPLMVAKKPQFEMRLPTCLCMMSVLFMSWMKQKNY